MSPRTMVRRLFSLAAAALLSTPTGCDLNETVTELAVETWYVPPGQVSQPLREGPVTVDPVRYTVDLYTVGEGNGRILASKYGIRCGRGEASPVCYALIPSGEILNLKAEPAASTTFGGWGGDCAAAKNSLYCDLRITKNMVISASMERRSCDASGSCWESLRIPGEDIRSVWSSAADDAWVAGTRGLLAHWDGSSWTRTSSATTEDLYQVWGIRKDDVWAVGANHSILHFDGRSWSPSANSARTDITSIFGATANDLWACCDRGTLLRWNGGSWAAAYGSSPIVSSSSLFQMWGSKSE
jgi:hypothetical protein